MAGSKTKTGARTGTQSPGRRPASPPSGARSAASPGRRPASPPTRPRAAPDADSKARVLIEHHLLEVKPASVEKVLSASPGLLARNAQWSAEMLGLAMHGAGRKAKWNLAHNPPEAEQRMEEHRRCFDLLLAHGASVNGDPVRITPLSHAVDVGYIPFVEALLARGADPHVVDEEDEDRVTVLDRVRQREGKSSEYGKARDRRILALLEAPR